MGKPHPLEVKGPILPANLSYLWNIFIQISRARPFTDGNFLPVPWSEIEAWSRLHRHPFKAWELGVITMLDDVWLTTMRKVAVSLEDLKEDEPDPEVVRPQLWRRS
jgi:hypothetical protein